MYKRLFKGPLNQSFFLFGPRGTGKTLWAKTHFPKALYLDLLESELFMHLLANPQRLEKLIPLNFNDWIIVDEVQKIPLLLNEVHRLIEKSRYKFILTGSSARSLKRKGVNLLAGRALTCKMHPLTAIELGNDFSIEKSLKYGHLPSVYSELNNPKGYLESYVQTYLQEEVQQEGLTRNLSAFSRFLEIASFSQGSVLNMSEVARESAIHRKIIENYFDIIEDLLLGKKLYAFTKKAKRKIISHPKFYFFDVGVYQTIRPKGPLDSPELAEGPALETLVYQEIQAINDYLNLDYELYYWRYDTTEVDFVLYGPRGLIAIEVKRSKRISGSDLKGLRSFGRDYPEAKLLFLYGGDRIEKEGNIQILPIVNTLKNLDTIL